MTPQVRGVLMALGKKPTSPDVWSAVLHSFFLLFLSGAGLCTTIGGACVFFLPSFQRLPLAVSMAVSSGVMLYVSFIEIFQESRHSMHKGLAAKWGTSYDDTRTIGFAYLFSTLSLFGGWWLATLVDYGIELFLHTCSFQTECDPANLPDLVSNGDEATAVCVELTQATPEAANGECGKRGRHKNSLDTKIVEDIDSSSGRSSKSTGDTGVTTTPIDSSSVEEYSANRERPSTKTRALQCWATNWDRLCTDKLHRSDSEAWEVAHAQECFRRDSRKFFQMGVFTALALGLHNIPEGVATFVGSLASPQLGASVAVAIGIHNIPEGFAVSVPLYFDLVFGFLLLCVHCITGTGKKWSSFFYAFLTGFAEPLGALLAWAVLGNEANPLALGVAFGLVCGIMSNIALKELLPAAYKYDPCNQVTTASFVGGMSIMAFSLVLFQFH